MNDVTKHLVVLFCLLLFHVPMSLQLGCGSVELLLLEQEPGSSCRWLGPWLTGRGVESLVFLAPVETNRSVGQLSPQSIQPELVGWKETFYGPENDSTSHHTSTM